MINENGRLRCRDSYLYFKLGNVLQLNSNLQLIYLYLITNMFKLCKRFFSFSNSKYFMDTSFKNYTAIAYDTPGALSRLCNVLASYGVSLSYLRTHCENRKKGDKVRYRLEISLNSSHHLNLAKASEELKPMGIELSEASPIIVPWFPRTRSDINKIGQVLLQVNESKEHSQFQDVQYRNRRDFIAKVAKEYKMDDKIPNIDYSEEEHQLWRSICRKLAPLHKEAMCQRFLNHSSDLQKQLKISQKIPQLGELSDYLHKKTGFTIKPTHGILSQREFLNAFAFKIFCSTQYLRNVKNPDYTPEPDIVHEILGHIPMFADPQVAELSQTIGLLSLGASDQEIAKLGSLYWFTLEFGVCRENQKIKGYGAGVASSIGEIDHFMGRGQQKPKFENLDIFRDCTASYPVQTVQPVFKVTQSFEGALKDLERYGRSIMKPMTTVFDEENDTISYDRNIEAVYTEDKGPKF